MNAVQPSTGAEDIASKLQIFLRGHGLTDPRITHLRRLTGGSSHDTWALDLTDGEAAPETPLIMRRNFAANSLDLPPEAEFRLVNWLAGAEIPVARPWLCATADSPFSVPFVLSERIDGTDLRKAMADPAIPIAAGTVALNLVTLQARIHALDITTCPLQPHERALRHEVERWTADMLTATHASPSPLARLAVHWLRANIPDGEKNCLVHGDFKANNILWRRNGSPVLLDWELAHIGDPVEDLAWTMLWMSKYDLVGGMLTPAQYVAAYEAAARLRVNRRRLLFWQLFAFVKLAVILLSGSGAISNDERLSPSHVLLSRAVPCLEAGMAAHLQALT